MTNVNNLPSLPKGTLISKFWLIEKTFAYMCIEDTLWLLMETAFVPDDYCMYAQKRREAHQKRSAAIQQLISLDRELGLHVWDQA